jgi:hypothetical protein
LCVEADEKGVVIRCFAATGCPEYDWPPVEDVMRWDRERGWAARYAGLGAQDDSVIGHAEVYRRSATESELVVGFMQDVDVPRGARVRLSRNKWLAEDIDVGPLERRNDGGFTAMRVPQDHRVESVEVVGPDRRSFASGRFW